MASKVKDMATATQAALRLNTGVEAVPGNGEPSVPKEKSTAEKLFPEFVTDDGGIINRPIRAYEDASKSLPAQATPNPAPQPPISPTAPPAPAYLTLEEMAGKMVKLKVDGVETDVPAESLLKTNQLERHLNTQLERLAQERTRFEQERTALLQRPIPLAPAPEPAAPKPGKPAPDPVRKSAEVEALENQIAQMQVQMQGLQATLIPQIQEAGIQRVDKLVKERIGTDDFRTHFEAIKQSALAEMAKPEVANNPQARNWFDSDNYYFQKYQEIKLRELTAKPVTPPAPAPANAPVLMTQNGAPVVMTSQGEPRSMPSFEGSGGVPSKAPGGDWQAKAQAAFDYARQNGSTEAWMTYYKVKAEGPQ